MSPKYLLMIRAGLIKTAMMYIYIYYIYIYIYVYNIYKYIHIYLYTLYTYMYIYNIYIYIIAVFINPAPIISRYFGSGFKIEDRVAIAETWVKGVAQNHALHYYCRYLSKLCPILWNLLSYLFQKS